MLESEEKEIDGKLYKFSPLQLKPARALFDRLVQQFGPAIAAAVEGLDRADLDESQEFVESLGSIAGSAAGLLRGVVQGLDSKTHEHVADVLAKRMHVQVTNDETGDSAWMKLTELRELMFGRNLLTEFKVIMFGLEVQYSDFLAPMRQAVQTAIALRATAVSRSDSRKASTGSSIGSPRVSDSAIA